MKKFKLTKESLAELAKVMPQLSEEEQRDCVGGKVVIVDQNGNLVRGNNQIINDYQAREQDTEHVYWYVTGDDGKVLNSIMSNGSVSSSNNNGSVKDMDMEGTAVNKNVMKFLSSSTSVEWGMALREEESNSGFYGRISTSDNCDLSSDSYTGYTEWYHSHPLDEKRKGEEFGPSSGDYEMISKLTDEKNGYNYRKITVYEPLTGEWITYYGKKGEGEVYENEMTRP